MYYTLERLKKSSVLKTCATSATEPKFNYLMIQIQNCAMYINQRVGISKYNFFKSETI